MGGSRHQVSVVTSHWEGLAIRETVDGMNLIRLRVGRQMAHQGRIIEMVRFMVKSAVLTKSLFCEFHPDICIAFMGIPSGLAPLVMKLKYGIPYVTELRGGDVPGFDPKTLGKFHFLTKPLIDIIWRNSHRLIANSTGLAELAKRSIASAGIQIIPNAVDSSTFVPAERQNSSDKMTLLFVGRFADSQKNISTLLRVLSRLEKVELILAGEGPDKAKLRNEVARYHLTQRVKFMGWLGGQELLSVYQRADVYVSASLWEGMPNTALEAISCGLPLLLSDVTGHRDLVEQGRNGYLFNPANENQLENFILQLKQDTVLRKKMGDTGRRIAQERYHWRKLAQEHLACFNPTSVKMGKKSYPRCLL